jgi:GH15 family glucan-1,4-alpha-glucosidase
MPTFRYDQTPDEFSIHREDRFPLSNNRLFVMQSSSTDLAAFVDQVRWPTPASDNWMHAHGCFFIVQDLSTMRIAKNTDGTLRVLRRRYQPDGTLVTHLTAFQGRLRMCLRDFVVPERDVWVRRVEIGSRWAKAHRVRLVLFFAPRTADESGTLQGERTPTGFLFYGRANAPFIALHCDRPFSTWLLAEGTYARAGVGDLPVDGEQHLTDRVELAAATDLELPPNRTVIIHHAIAFDQSAEGATLVVAPTGQAQGLPLRGLYAQTRRWWQTWFRDGVVIKTRSRKVDWLYRVNLMVARMCQAENGGLPYVGCGDYGARAWPRDVVWYALGMDYAGHHAEAEKALEWCTTLKRKDDGSFYVNYLVDGDRPDWTQPEYDCFGEILAGFWLHYLFTRRERWLARHWVFLRGCADAIVKLAESNNLVRADTSIWEDHLAQNTFTSGVCAFGLWCAARVAERLKERDYAASWEGAAKEIKQAILTVAYDATRGCLTVNPGSRHVDGAVLTLNSWFPLLSGEDKFERGLLTMVDALWHDTLGGLRRREQEENTPRQDWDKFPWPGVTLWAADAFIEVGRWQDAARYLNWVTDHAMPEGLLAENVHPGSHSRFPMPSYSSAGFARTLIRLGGLEFDGELHRGRPAVLPRLGRVRLHTAIENWRTHGGPVAK